MFSKIRNHYQLYFEQSGVGTQLVWGYFVMFMFSYICLKKYTFSDFSKFFFLSTWPTMQPKFIVAPQILDSLSNSNTNFQYTVMNNILSVIGNISYGHMDVYIP